MLEGTAILKRYIVIKPATSVLRRLIDWMKIDIEHIVSVSSLDVECKLTLVKQWCHRYDGNSLGNDDVLVHPIFIKRKTCQSNKTLEAKQSKAPINTLVIPMRENGETKMALSE